MNLIITNAFSISMLTGENRQNVSFLPLGLPSARFILDKHRASGAPVQSAVGHAPTAAIFSEQLNAVIPANRVNVTLDSDTTLLVGQYIGPRLEEGVTSLPEGAEIRWYMVVLLEPQS